MSQQRCSELEGKLLLLQQQHRTSLQTNPANVIEAARASAIADLEQASAVMFHFYCLFIFISTLSSITYSCASIFCCCFIVVPAFVAASDHEQSRNSLSERCIQLESLLAQVRISALPHISLQKCKIY